MTAELEGPDERESESAVAKNSWNLLRHCSKLSIPHIKTQMNIYTLIRIAKQARDD